MFGHLELGKWLPEDVQDGDPHLASELAERDGHPLFLVLIALLQQSQLDGVCGAVVRRHPPLLQEAVAGPRLEDLGQVKGEHQAITVIRNKELWVVANHSSNEKNVDGMVAIAFSGAKKEHGDEWLLHDRSYLHSVGYSLWRSLWRQSRQAWTPQSWCPG